MHQPVLLKEVLQYLNPKSGEFIIDGTVDGGGHAAKILKEMIPRGKYLALDLDSNLLESTRIKIEAKFPIPNSKLLGKEETTRTFQKFLSVKSLAGQMACFLISVFRLHNLNYPEGDSVLQKMSRSTCAITSKSRGQPTR